MTIAPFIDNDETSTVTSVAADEVRTRTIADLADDAGFLNSRVWLHHQDAAQLHGETTQLHTGTLRELLRTRSGELAAEPLVELLAMLADEGFAWRDVARLVGVSVPALRKWRQGEAATGENRLKVASLVALCEVLRDKALQSDPASWLELPMLEDVPVTGLDLYAANRIDLLFRRALHFDADPETILDEFDPSWRSTYRGAFEVFEAEDGLPGIRLRDSDG